MFFDDSENYKRQATIKDFMNDLKDEFQEKPETFCVKALKFSPFTANECQE